METFNQLLIDKVHSYMRNQKCFFNYFIIYHKHGVIKGYREFETEAEMNEYCTWDLMRDMLFLEAFDYAYYNWI